ncbi:MAG TPA: ABC transporter substrate-binding protein [Hyphomicrobiales bacterium]|nr:ABC transporter substrate-binding protein [Hyphomicrobiales bacterium]
MSDKTTGGAGIGRRDFLKVTAAGAALLLPASVRAAAAEPRKGGILKLAMPYNPAALDPMTGRNLPDFNTLFCLYDALIDFDPDTLELKPGLAKAWKFTDPKTLVLDLVDGISFHDGSPLTPGVVKFNLDRYKSDKRSNVKPDLATVASVEVTGKSQVTLHLTKPNSGLPAILTNRAGLMVSMKSIQAAKGGNVDRAPVGTGPFTFVSWQDNDKITLTRNKTYWRGGGLPYLEGVELRIINELNTGARTVIAGETQLAFNMGVTQKLEADKIKGLVATASPALLFFGAHLNYAQGPMKDVRIRQALNWGINREEINQVIMHGLGEPSSFIMPKNFWATDPATFDYYSYDPGRAKKLLAEAGFANGITITSWGWPDQASMQRQELIVTQLAKVGIHVKLTAQSPVQVATQFYLQKHGDMYIAPSGGYPDPTQYYDALYAKDALLNAASIELPGYRALTDATSEAQTQDARKAAFAKLQRFTIEQAMELPQYISPGITIRSEKVQNFRFGLLQSPKFTEVWLAA